MCHGISLGPLEPRADAFIPTQDKQLDQRTRGPDRRTVSFGVHRGRNTGRYHHRAIGARCHSRRVARLPPIHDIGKNAACPELARADTTAGRYIGRANRTVDCQDNNGR